MEGIAKKLDSGVVGRMESVTVNIMWKLQHSWLRVILRVECRVLV